MPGKVKNSLEGCHNQNLLRLSVTSGDQQIKNVSHCHKSTVSATPLSFDYCRVRGNQRKIRQRRRKLRGAAELLIDGSEKHLSVEL